MSLAVFELSCTRGERLLFDRLEFQVAWGVALQVRGANGSGKTSLLRILAGLALADSGEIHVDGQRQDLADEAYRGRLAYLGHANGLKASLSPVENLRFAASLNAVSTDRDRLESALARVGLYGFEDTPVQALSAGQNRRTALARLVVAEAAIWLLDEPFTALDPDGQRLVSTLLAEHLAAGGLAVLSTHQRVPDGAFPLASLQLDGIPSVEPMAG